MSVYKCKMCGANLNISEGSSICTCEYCDTVQTVPNAGNEKMVSLFSRANRLRSANEFDKASGVYESIVAEFPEEAEAYWGLVLCKYGIEYVDDPATGKKIPTCHRSSFESVFDDTNFDQTCENADAIARPVYRAEAKQIEELRKSIIEVSAKEEPYDIFICYKETDENGDRTTDSVIAQDVYDALTEKGYRVFFSRISLEDKLGQEYEPYIFAALNSAKIMLVFGTDYEYFNAVWVKNEWNRFLQLIAKGEKKTLIPCFKGIDAYDMPKEFTKLQAQDMGKIGAIQDLIRGIEKIFPQNRTTGSAAPITEEKKKRLNGPSLIKSVKLVGVNDPSEFSSDAPVTSVFDRSEISLIILRITLKDVIDLNPLPQGFDVYDSKGNKVFSRSRDGEHKATNKSMRMKWKIKNDDGTYLYEPGEYHLEAWVCDSQVFEYNFQITDSSQLDQKDKRINGPDLISGIQLRGTNDPGDIFPKSAAMNNIDRSEFSCIAIQILLGKTINEPKADYGLTIYDENDNQVFKYSNELDFKPTYTTISKTWPIKDGEAYNYDVGTYRLEAWVLNSKVFEYTFKLYDSKLDKQNENIQDDVPDLPVDQNTSKARVARLVKHNHRNRRGRDLIAFLHFVCADRADDYFPVRAATRRVDLARFSYLSLQFYLQYPSEVFTTVEYNFTVYDCYNNEIINKTMQIDIEPGFDKFCLMLILKENGVVNLSPGEYIVDVWIADSKIVTGSFTIYDSSDSMVSPVDYVRNIPDEYTEDERQKMLARLVEQKQYLLQERSKVKKSLLSAKKILNLEAEIAAVDLKIGVLSEVDDL